MRLFLMLLAPTTFVLMVFLPLYLKFAPALQTVSKVLR